MRESVAMPQLPRPGPVLKWMMGILIAIWLAFAVGINFLGLPPSLFLLFVGNTDAILHGQVWRLLTAGFVHAFSGPGAVWGLVWTLLGLYFFAPTLERKWGSRRMVAFLLASMLLGFAMQVAAEALLPRGLSERLGQDVWFGAMGAVEAVAVAWALTNRDQSVNLMFFLPVRANVLLLFVVGMSVLRVVAADKPSEGVFTPFGGMLAGYLFGGSQPSPAGRLYLRIRYLWLARRAAQLRRQGSQPRLRVIEGAGAKGSQRGKRSPSDKRFLN